MDVIRVPKTPKKAFDPQRPAGTLLQSQLKHLEWAIRPAGERSAKVFRFRPARTEAEAAARIAKLNEELHRQATAPRDVLPPSADMPAQRPATVPASRKSRQRPRTKQKPATRSRSRRASKRRTSR